MSSASRLLLAGTPVLCALAACGKDPPPALLERPPAPVSVATAEARSVPVYLDEIGRCVAREMVSVQPQISGAITAIHFADGADLKAGDALFSIDPRPYQAQLDAAEASLAEERAALEWNRIELERARSLLQDDAVSRSDFDARSNGVQVAEAKVQQSIAAVAAARLDLEYCEIRSPIDGRAGRRLVDLGNVVGPGTALLVIQRLDPIYADFTVTENDLSLVQQSMARHPLAVEVRLPDEPDAPLAGELSFLDNTVQQNTGTIELRATIPNAEHRLWPGRFVKVRLVLDTLPDAVLVPASAPQISAQGSFLYVVKDDGTAEMRPVRTGQRHGDLLVVSEGVQAGERVVVAGQIAVTPGGKVRVVEPAAGPAAGK